MAWDHLRGGGADPHDLIAQVVILAACNADVDALNLGAQVIARPVCSGPRTPTRCPATTPVTT